jgi:putative transposase
MARKRPEFPPVHRTDLLPSNLTASKEAKVVDLLAHYRDGAVLLGREQWKLFFDTGKFSKNHDVDKVTFAVAIGAANRVQMCRYQVVGQLQGWVSNRANDFRDTVTGSKLHPDKKHMLHVVNRMGAWFLRGDIAMKETGEIIPVEVRKLARSIMRHVMEKHRRPNLSRISMRLDHRAGCIAAPVKATPGGKVAWWINMSTMEPGKKIAVPLLNYDYHKNRPGRVTNGLQVNRNRDGVLSFGIVIDMAEPCAKSRAEYGGMGAIALDFGLSTMFATSEGQLLGQGWLKRLRRYDALLTMIAATQQRMGKKPRDSKRYRGLVEDVRGFIRTEVGRVLNLIVVQGKPKELVLERLDFRNPDLSRRLNRLIQNCGRSVIQSKLADLEQRFGITSTEVNPAYTSQTCAACGYVDAKNRRSQSRFQCLWCGHTKHADLNAAQNIDQRRALVIGSVFQSKAAVLAVLVRQFGERHTGSRDAPADPRLTNPYFGGVREAVVRLSERRKVPMKSVVTPALVAA